MAGQNTQIIFTDYNEIQSKIAVVMGSGSGNIGYGQTLASSQVSQFGKITVAQWNNLRTDIIKCRQHQTGTTIGSKAPGEVGYTAGADLPIPTASTQVKDSWRDAYKKMAIDCEAAAITAPPPTSEATRSNLVGVQQRTAAWNGTIYQTITVDFGSADAARYFFNTGSQIEFAADRSGGSAGTKNTSWTTLLSNMGRIAMNYNGTTTTGTGVTQTIGWYNLTTSDQVIFEKDVAYGAAYYPNKFYIYAKVNSTSNRQIGYFTMYFADDSLAPASTPDPGFGIDENVDGTLTTTVTVYRATGTNVSTPMPYSATSTVL